VGSKTATSCLAAKHQKIADAALLNYIEAAATA
jgi:hypothetical protein